MNLSRKVNTFLSTPVMTNVHATRFIHLPSTMKCLAINNYASKLDDLDVTKSMKCFSEKDLLPDQALIKVHAASVNPFDIEMTQGYGRNALNLFRKLAKASEFPLVLGRDCSGVVVARGKRFRRLKVGDSVSCVRWITGQGTHAEYCIVNKNEISLKPINLNYEEAASIPYVACTTWNALINSGAVPVNGRAKRILIPAGSGGIGSFAIQLCNTLGHDVVTTCATDAIPLVNKLGIQNVIDYKSDTYLSDLENAGPFDVIYDTLNEMYQNIFIKLLKQNPFSKYVSLRPTLLPDTDKHGIMLGTLNAGSTYIKSSMNQLSYGKGGYHWGFFSPNALVLDQIKPFIENGEIKPVIDRVIPLNDIMTAYKHVENGHTRGKTILRMV